MRHSYEQIRQSAHELPAEQRLELANSLWDSINPGEAELSEAEIVSGWGKEITRRLDEIDSGAVELIAWEPVRAEMVEALSPQAKGRLHI